MSQKEQVTLKDFSSLKGVRDMIENSETNIETNLDDRLEEINKQMEQAELYEVFLELEKEKKKLESMKNQERVDSELDTVSSEVEQQIAKGNLSSKEEQEAKDSLGGFNKIKYNRLGIKTTALGGKVLWDGKNLRNRGRGDIPYEQYVHGYNPIVLEEPLPKSPVDDIRGVKPLAKFVDQMEQEVKDSLKGATEENPNQKTGGDFEESVDAQFDAARANIETSVNEAIKNAKQKNIPNPDSAEDLEKPNTEEKAKEVYFDGETSKGFNEKEQAYRKSQEELGELQDENATFDPNDAAAENLGTQLGKQIKSEQEKEQSEKNAAVKTDPEEIPDKKLSPEDAQSIKASIENKEDQDSKQRIYSDDQLKEAIEKAKQDQLENIQEIVEIETKLALFEQEKTKSWFNRRAERFKEKNPKMYKAWKGFVGWKQKHPYIYRALSFAVVGGIAGGVAVASGAGLVAAASAVGVALNKKAVRMATAGVVANVGKHAGAMGHELLFNKKYDRQRNDLAGIEKLVKDKNLNEDIRKKYAERLTRAHSKVDENQAYRKNLWKLGGALFATGGYVVHSVLEGDVPDGSDSDDAIPEETPEKVVPPEEVVTPDPEETPNGIHKDAYVRDGDGITWILKRQLDENLELAEKFGVAGGTPQEYAKLAENFGIMDGEHEVRLKLDPESAYVPSLDSEGNPIIQQFKNGELVDTYCVGDSFEGSTIQSTEYIEDRGVGYTTQAIETEAEVTSTPVIETASELNGDTTVTDTELEQALDNINNTQSYDVAGNPVNIESGEVVETASELDSSTYSDITNDPTFQDTINYSSTEGLEPFTGSHEIAHFTDQTKRLLEDPKNYDVIKIFDNGGDGRTHFGLKNEQFNILYLRDTDEYIVESNTAVATDSRDSMFLKNSSELAQSDSRNKLNSLLQRNLGIERNLAPSDTIKHEYMDTVKDFVVNNTYVKLTSDQAQYLINKLQK